MKPLAYGVTELYSLIAAGAAKRLGLTPTYGHLDSTSFHVDGRYNCDEPPSEGVVRLTQGYSRDHRPDLNQVMLELIVEHQAGIPLLMKPLSGNSSDTQEFGQIVRDHIAQLHSTYGTTYVGSVQDPCRELQICRMSCPITGSHSVRSDIEQSLSRRNLINLAHFLSKQPKDFDLHLVQTFNQVVNLILHDQAEDVSEVLVCYSLGVYESESKTPKPTE